MAPQPALLTPVSPVAEILATGPRPVAGACATGPRPVADWRHAMLLEISPATVTVNGYLCTVRDPAWTGLDLAHAELRESASIAAVLLGADAAPFDHHPDTPWCHPLDQPTGWEAGIRYCVRPRRAGWRFERGGGRWLLVRA